MKNFFPIFIVLVTLSTTLNAQWMELVTPTINYEIKSYSFLDLEINLEGEPYLLYDCKVPNGNGSDFKLFVQKYDAANEEWSIVGGGFVNELNAFKNYMAIDSESNVYVAFLKVGAGVSTCTVKKFDGTDWITIGEWDVGVLTEVAMYCDNQDDVYISHSDITYPGQVVKRYLGTGSNWETLGDAPYLSNIQCLTTSITTDNDGNVLVSYGTPGGLSVKKINGSTWEYVGSSTIGDEPLYPTSIVVGSDDVIYATTTDYWSSASNVHSYQNNAWQNQLICYGGGYMPFTKYNDDVYMGHYISDNGLRSRVKKVDNSGIWVDLPEQPGIYFTSPSIPTTFLDIEADNNGNLYMVLLKGDNFNHHVSVIKLDITTGITKHQNEPFAVYPNPSNGDFNIKVHPEEKILNVKITNINGKTVYTGADQGTCHLEKGIYFITIKTNKGIYTEKLIIK